MSEKLKENWFVVLVAVILIGAVTFYTYDTNKGKLPGKKVDGKDVVATIGDTDYFADDLYTELFGDETNASSVGNSILFTLYQRAVVDAAVEVDSDMKLKINNSVANMKSYYSGQETTLLSILKQYGYSSLDDLEDFFTIYFKQQKLVGDYFDQDLENLFKDVYAEESPRIVSHILVKTASKDAVTDEEQKKMDEVDAALKEGKDFATVAKEYSDDGSASDGGNLGYVDANTSFVEPFLKAALAAEKGVVTDWIRTDYGYHKILVTENDMNALLENEDIREDIHAAIETAHPELTPKILWEKGQELGIKFANENIENAIKELLDLKEEK